MRWLFLSPEFPPNYHLFAWHFRELGGVAVGIGHTPFQELPVAILQSLIRYEAVSDLHDTEAVLRAARQIAHEVGGLDGVDSFNEYWLPLEAAIRAALNVPGPKPADLPAFQHKSEMKAYFQRASLDPIPGRVVKDFAEVTDFVATYGFPIIAKPDRGVGAGGAICIQNEKELERFQHTFRPGYLLEKFITGTIQTFDGLTDHDGQMVFYASLEYSRGVAEVVSQDEDIYYYVRREIEPDLVAAGKAIVAAYGLRARFFHFEFIRAQDEKLYPLEVNMRPPGYPTLDLFNFAHDIDLYRGWAEVILGHRPVFPTPSYYACYISRKRHIGYAHDHEAVLKHLGERLILHAQTIPLFRAAMGDEHYIVRTPSYEDMLEMAHFVQKRLIL